ncbi:MAG TPA: hypothetical protein VD813_05740, partial [Pseudonocardia sp.]|nr:hypothetical protein [Pseudonocardia sp.]
AFVGCDGVTAERVYVEQESRAETLRRVVGAGRRVILIAASSAVGVEAGTAACEVEELDACIATGDVPAPFARQLTAKGLQFLATS